MKKFLKWFGLGAGGLLLVGLIVAWIMDEPEPPSNPSPEADALARRMLRAINHDAWDTTRWVGWTFAGAHHYHWDKERHWVQVAWNDYRVLLDTKASEGVVYEKEEVLEGEEARKLIRQAEGYFNNDSFWLNAPAKAFDPGTERSIVTLDGQQLGLMVSYQTGGTTPGDRYVWVLNEQGLPRSWKMWVSIIPIGGVSAIWEEWTELSTGARVATQHRLGPVTLRLTDVRGGQRWDALDLASDPFEAFVP